MTCSAEDLVILKAFAGRGRDWTDIETVLIRQRDLRWPLVREELRPLLELSEAPEKLEQLLKLKERLESSR